ncbi:MAG: DNA polymerase III [Candidatus Portnoybacteria bacterium RBG_13_40_8]|uniref:DNA polymerase beta n=1 Tax=Candidatus Portnoybacteria bacterium RBG_13_40_8 TaxID=1801990 RepID=A0A1G2F518_9BACT|nr:MAG: DNA polymerase III [Candidatus Portnoybacteria bacterium RBG_13_40_8]OGZ34683.1 MAG: DNA polymerase III [Candidatus Portnoybacteria bacterium RIFCSPHIGHO2_01_FULL_39_19]
MDNKEIAKILYEISEYLSMEDVPFKPRAYERAAMAIEELENRVEDIYKKEGLEGLINIPTVGKGIAERIKELIRTGKIRYYEQLKKKTPVKVDELTAVEGVGPKIIKRLYKEIGVKNLIDLEKAAMAGKIRKLEGFGQKSEENILRGINFLKSSGGRFVLGFIMPEVREIEKRIGDFPGVKKAIIAGSIRRMKETIGDGDLLVTVSSPRAGQKIMEIFVNMPEVMHVYSQGPTKSSVRLKNGMDFDLRVVPEESFGAALQYFTGSKDHNIELRKIAIKKGLKLNEYGVFRGKKMIVGKNEEEVYKILGLKWMEPELRENAGEIEAAQNNRLPKIIGYNDLQGDLQIQTNWTDGSNSIEDYVEEAIKLGLEYILITDHTKSLAMTHGLDERGLARQGREIDKINSKLKAQNSKLRVLKGAEVNILKDGRLDIKDDTLHKLDVVAIAVHSGFKMSKRDITERIIKAMKNPHTDILFHPTGRLINQRPPYEVDVEKIIRVAKETKTVLEVNAYPNRLDLKDEYARMAKNMGVKLSIDSDAHHVSHLHFLEFGIAQARRGWVEKKDVINAWPVEKMLKMLKH